MAEHHREVQAQYTAIRNSLNPYLSNVGFRMMTTLMMTMMMMMVVVVVVVVMTTVLINNE